jgi:hypothetical protein
MSKSFLLSPVGEAFFPRLQTPDTKFDAKGKFSTNLLLDPSVPEHAKFISEIEAIAKAEVGSGATLPIRDHLDPEGNPTGKKLVKFSSAFKPKLFDAANRPWDEAKIVGGGSTIQVSASPHIYQKIAGRSGVNLYLLAVRVLDLVEPMGSGAEAYGFTPGTGPAEQGQPDENEDLPTAAERRAIDPEDNLPF